MEWANRLGMVLEFLSFWFAAPEILGEERLKALERRVEQAIRVGVLPYVLTALVIAVMIIAMLTGYPEARLAGLMTMESLGAILGVGLLVALEVATATWKKPTPRPLKWSVGLMLGLALGVVVELASSAWTAGAWTWVGKALSAALVLVLLTAIKVKKTSRALLWAAMAVVTVGVMAVLTWPVLGAWGTGALAAGALMAVEEKVARPLLRVLADDERIRQRSLVVGAALFVVGFLLQLIATF